MRRHWSYLKYVLLHKWYVFLACARYRIWWRGIKHDWSKFTLNEWCAYARSFYNRDGTRRDSGTRTAWDKAWMDHAWNHHQKVNDHHWQFWCLITDSREPRFRPLLMPEECVLEMVADWVGAGRGITGRISVREWYAENTHKIMLHPVTRERVEKLLEDWK